MDTNNMREQFESFAREVLDWSDDEFRLASDGKSYYWGATGEAWLFWQASRKAVAVGLPGLTDELLTAAYWDFDARRKGYPPYAAPAGQECSAFKVAIVGAIEAQGMKVAP